MWFGGIMTLECVSETQHVRPRQGALVDIAVPGVLSLTEQQCLTSWRHIREDGDGGHYTNSAGDIWLLLRVLMVSKTNNA